MMTNPTPVKLVGHESVAQQQERLLRTILRLRRQVRMPTTLDKYIPCLSIGTSYEGKLPVPPKQKITEGNRDLLLCNLISWAVLTWGEYARGVTNRPDNPYLDEMVRISDGVGYTAFAAYPRQKGAPDYVLRTADEQAAVEAAERARQEGRHEQNAAESPVAGGVDAVVPKALAGVSDDEPSTAGDNEGVSDEGRDGEGVGVGDIGSETVQGMGDGEDDEAGDESDREGEIEAGDEEDSR